jgi:hypothetical protein
MNEKKKTASKPKSPAPATKAKKLTTKKSPLATIVEIAPTPVPALAAVATAPKAASAAPFVKAVAPAAVRTRIVVRADVGFGNALYLRGDGPGLSWSEGVAMECVAADQWEYTLGESSRPVSFKVLVNDRIWASGPDQVVASGSTATITPEFA